MALHSLLKELLVCPQCRGELEERTNSLLCATCGLSFPIRDSIPVMLIEEATKISPDEIVSSGVASSEKLSGESA